MQSIKKKFTYCLSIIAVSFLLQGGCSSSGSVSNNNSSSGGSLSHCCKVCYSDQGQRACGNKCVSVSSSCGGNGCACTRSSRNSMITGLENDLGVNEDMASLLLDDGFVTNE